MIGKNKFIKYQKNPNVENDTMIWMIQWTKWFEWYSDPNDTMILMIQRTQWFEWFE